MVNLPSGPKIRSLRNQHAGKRTFIIGNGPSLKRQDLSCLRNEYVFAVNLFTLHSEFNYLRNCYYCLGDPRFYQKGHLLLEISEKLSRHAGVMSFFDVRASEAVLKEHKMEKNRVYFVEIDPSHKCWEGWFHEDLEEKLCWGYSVIIDQCIPIAIYMGFNPIYLIGCDCDYGLDTGSSDFSNAYFYDPKIVSPEYMDSLESSKTLPDQFNQSGKIIASYQAVRAYCQEHGVNILNAGCGGRLEVFDRVSFPSLFEGGVVVREQLTAEKPRV